MVFKADDEQKGEGGKDNLIEDSRPELDDVAELLAGIDSNSDTLVSVSKMNGRKFEWLFDLDANQLDAAKLRADLRDEYGGGDYKIVARRAGVFVGHKTLSIGGVKTNHVAKVDSSSQSDRIGELMAMMQNQMAQSQANFQQLMLQQSKENQQQQMELMRLMIEKGNSGSKDMDVIGLLTLAKELFSRKDDSVGLLLKGIELHKELAGENGGEGGGLKDVIAALGAPLANIVAAQAQAKQTQPQQSESEDKEVENVKMAQGMQIRAAAAMFVKAASEGKDVKRYAELFCEQYGDMVPDEFLQEPEQFNQIFDLVPEAVPYREWFERLRVECIEILFEDDNSPD